MSDRIRVLVRGKRSHGDVVLEGDGAHHLARVVRVREGEGVTVFDGDGFERTLTVAQIEVSKRGARVVLRGEAPWRAGVTAAKCALELCVGLPSAEKIDGIVRHAAELGVSVLRLVVTERSAAVGKSVGEEKRSRWRTISESASAQCGRADVMEVCAPLPLAVVLGACEAPCKIVLWENETAPFATVLAGTPSGACALLVGPEGGLSAAEVSLAREKGFASASLGPRVLRVETAALAGAAVVVTLRS